MENINNSIEDEQIDNNDSDDDSTQHLHKVRHNKKNIKRGRIFIRNLPFTATEESIKELFLKIGPVYDVSVPKNPSTNQIKGFGFLQYTTKKEALTAIKKLNLKKFEGRALSISLACTKEDYGDVKERQIQENLEGAIFKKDERLKRLDEKNKQNFDPSRTLFINNLNYMTDESSLREFYETYGKVIYVKIVRNNETKTSKGSGFVMMKLSQDAQNIVKAYNKYSEKNSSDNLHEDKLNINQFELDGRNMNIQFAVSKDNAEKLKNSEESQKNKDHSRNRHLLYYGIGNTSLLKLDNKVKTL